jgi:hypothetical protein
MAMRLLTLVALVMLLVGAVAAAQRQVYLPLVMRAGESPAPQIYQINVPYFPASELNTRFGELAIFWFGQVDRTRNYADVRVGSNDSELFIYVAVFDRRLWYDSTPSPEDLHNWDALTLYLDDGRAAHRLVAQLSEGGGPAYQAAYRAGPTGWQPANTAFTTVPGWRGEQLNDDGDDRGWAMTFRVPFASLGLSERPAEGTRWRMALRLDDRDDQAGTPISPQFWPPAFAPEATASWGGLHFGLPRYTPPPASASERFSLRHGQAGLNVPDAAVGGGAICGDGLDFWSEWGDSSRDAGRADFNIQNQSDIADWPCFAKYYVTFPLDSLPPGRSVIAAQLVLHHFGNAQPADAKPSLIQVHVVERDWEESALSWNNAPLARENVGAAWVPPLLAMPDWPGVPREFELSRAVAEAYAAGEPLRLALYSADSDYHSGKYFVSSDTGDWNAAGRPTLLVTLSK